MNRFVYAGNKVLIYTSYFSIDLGGISAPIKGSSFPPGDENLLPFPFALRLIEAASLASQVWGWRLNPSATRFKLSFFAY